MLIGFYYTHYQCLGHTSRVFSIVSALKKELSRARVIGIEGSLPQEFLKSSPFSETHTLPFPFYSRENFVRTFMAEPLAVKARAAACLALAQRAKLDVLFTEFFPFGRADCWPELLPTLIDLKSKGKRLFSSAGYPVLSGGGRARLDSLMPFYRKMYLHCPHDEVDYMAAAYPKGEERRRYVDFFKKHAEQIVFTGYIAPDGLSFKKELSQKVALPKGKVNVLVTRGAGAYSADLITTALEASESLGEDFFVTLVAGPSTTEQEWSMFQAVLARKKVKNARLIRMTGYFEKLIEDSDLCVCPVPYNTSTLLLKHKKKAVLIPFTGSGDLRFREQTARARLLQDHLGAAVITSEALSPQALAEAIRRGCKGPARSRIPAEWMNGRSNFLKDFKKTVSKV